MTSSVGGGSSGSGSRAGSAASGRPPSPFNAARHQQRPDSDADQWHGGSSSGAALLPLQRGLGKRRVASTDGLPLRPESQMGSSGSGLLSGSPPELPAGGASSGSAAGGGNNGGGSGGGGAGSFHEVHRQHGGHGHGLNGGGGANVLGRPPLAALSRSRSRSPPPNMRVVESSPPPGCASWRSCLASEPLLLLTLAGVLAGVLLGVALKPAELGQEAVELIGFPGEIMLRLLKMLVLPLVSVSMVAGVVSLRQPGGSAAGADGSGGQRSVRRLAHLTAAFYIGSTLLAILVGIVLVVVVHPGRGAPFDRIAAAGSGGCHKEEAKKVAEHTSASMQHRTSTTEALLNVARQVVPDNLVGAAVDMNVLGIITFSLMFGMALASLGPAADGLIKTIGVLNAAVQKMVTAALWLSPLGIGSLIAASILRACDLLGTLAALGLWVATVLAGLAFFAAVALPLLLWGFTGRSPLAVARTFAQPLLMAFGTSSSAAALPLAMQSAKDMGCDEATVNFFLPLGTAVNMNGTALYEATTAIFIAQAHGVHLDFAQLLVVAFTASLAAVGAPAIPSAGLVTMLIVLQAVDLDRYAADLAVILAIDWLLDRVRTTINLLGDAFGCVLVDDLLKKKRQGGGGGGRGVAGGPQIPYIQLEMGDHHHHQRSDESEGDASSLYDLQQKQGRQQGQHARAQQQAQQQQGQQQLQVQQRGQPHSWG